MDFSRSAAFMLTVFPWLTFLSIKNKMPYFGCSMHQLPPATRPSLVLLANMFRPTLAVCEHKHNYKGHDTAYA
jgi:hypothetical protein